MRALFFTKKDTLPHHEEILLERLSSEATEIYVIVEVAAFQMPVLHGEYSSTQYYTVNTAVLSTTR
jgi:hypothetical protein